MRTTVDTRAVIAAISAITSVGIALGLSYPLLSILMEQRGYSSSLIGANSAIGGVAGIIAVPFVTSLARKFSVVASLVTSAIIASACFLAFYFTHSIFWWFVLRFILFVCLSFAFVLSEFWINASVTERRRGLYLGVYATVLSVGFALGPGILALVGTAGPTPFVIGSVLILLSNLPVLIARKNQPIFETEPTKFTLFTFVLLIPTATVAAFAFGAAEQSVNSLLPVYGIGIGYTESSVALLLMCLGLGNIVSQLPLGWLGDRMAHQGYTRRPLLLFCAVIGVLGAISFPFVVHTGWLMAVTLFVWGGVAAGLYTLALAHLGSRITNNTQLAQANSAFALCYCTGMLVGPQSVGIAMDLFPVHGFSLSIAALFVLYCVVVSTQIYIHRRKTSFSA